jgi:crotonobetaine/carnitine-CoA ligase
MPQKSRAVHLLHKHRHKRYDTHGRVHFVMRNQDAIRRRGENISAVELERVALSHPMVVDAAAYAVPAELGEHEVKLDLVVRDGTKLDDLHAWLRDQLPRFMVPRYLEARTELPRTPSQRVEKYKLAATGLDRPSVREYDARRTQKLRDNKQLFFFPVRRKVPPSGRR